MSESINPNLSQAHKQKLQVKQAIARLDRAIRTYKTFQGKGSTVAQALSDANGSLLEIIAYGPAIFKVVPFGLIYQDAVLHTPNKRAWYWSNLFCEGIREITFAPGLTENEIHELIDVLCMDVGSSKNDDIVTLLWRREVHHINLYMASFDTPELEEDETGDLILTGKDSDPFLDAYDQASTTPISYGSDDLRYLFDKEALNWMKILTGLQGLTPKGTDWLLGGHERPQTADAADQRFVALLIDAANHLPTSDTSEQLVTPLISGMLEVFTSRKDNDRIISLLNGLFSNQSPVIDSILKNLLKGDWCRRMAPLYDQKPSLFRTMVEQLINYDNNALVKLLVELKEKNAQQELKTVIEKANGNLIPFFSKQIQDPNSSEKEMKDAIQGLSRFDSPEVISALASVVEKGAHPSVQYLAMRALANQYHPQHQTLLEKTLEHERSAMRLLALASFKKSGAPWLSTLVLKNIQAPGFASRPKPEQFAFFVALADLGDKKTKDFFRKVLMEKNITRRKSILDRKLLVIDAISKAATKSYKDLFIEIKKQSWASHKTVRQGIVAYLERQT